MVNKYLLMVLMITVLIGLAAVLIGILTLPLRSNKILIVVDRVVTICMVVVTIVSFCIMWG